MKINKIKIASFGKFKDKEINFRDGFNLVYGENEMGKTTVMEFIKMMFYGSKKVSDAANNPRKRYFPWNNDKMAGSIEFEQAGTFYRLDREFRASNSTDKITLWNLDTGESENISGATDIGARFFGLGAGAFEKSLFIANDPSFSSDAAADGEINAKLSSLTASFEDDTSAEQVISRVSDAANQLSTKTGRGGSIARLEAEREQLIAAQRKNEALCREREAIEEEINTVRAELVKVIEERNDCFEGMKLAEKAALREKLLCFIAAAENYEKTEAGIKNAAGETVTPEIIEEASGKLELLKRYESENINSQEAIISLTDEMAKLSSFDNSTETAELENQKQTLLSEFEAAQGKIKEIEIALMSAQNERENIKPKPNIVLIIIGSLLILGGVALAVAVMPYFAGLCAVGAALVAIGILKKKKADTSILDNKISVLEREKENLVNEQNSVSGKMREISEKLSRASVESNTNERIMAAKREENLRRREKQLEDMAKTDSLRRELLDLLVPFGCKASTSG
ncbi:MAG: AAA family ATPase, partial [Clostridiales bacterium]|nr:AAA family ATPase [Candidatus Equinaster intestinalis]